MSLKKSKSLGFTLLEVLLVIGLIAILAGIVIVAINPGRQLAAVRNAERQSNLKQIYNAIQQYYIDFGAYPATIPESLTEICDTGTLPSPSDLPCTGGLIDLSALVPDYLVAIPVDPLGPVLSFLNPIIPTVYAADEGTGYSLAEDANHKISLSATRVENGVTIAIGDLPADTFTVTFDSEGGSAVSAITGITSGDTITLPTPPTKDGYTFDAWYEGDNGTGDEFTESTEVIASITVYAGWVESPIHELTASSPLWGVATNVWHFNGDATDAKGGLNGTNNGADITTGLWGGSAYSFVAASSDHIDIGNISALNGASQDYTISVWVKVHAAVGAVVIIYDYENGNNSLGVPDIYLLHHDGQTNFVYSAPNDGEIDSLIPVAGMNADLDWHMLTVTTGTDRGVDTYIDGVWKKHWHITGDCDSNYNFSVAEGVNANHWNGDIDELIIFSTKLTSQQVADLYETATW